MVETNKQSADTFPRLLQQHAHTRPTHPAFREKHLGIWQTTTWADVETHVRLLACGLAALGFQRGMNLAVVGDNTPRLFGAVVEAPYFGGGAGPLHHKPQPSASA